MADDERLIELDNENNNKQITKNKIKLNGRSSVKKKI